MNNQHEYFDNYKEKLYKLLCYCKEEIEYYKNNWDFEIPSYEQFTYEFFSKEVPILEKENVREKSEAFFNKSISTDMLSIDSTSGTEGKAIICYRSKQERNMCSNSLWRLRRRFVNNIKPSDKFARFYAFRNKEKNVVTNEVLYKDSDILLPLFDLSDEKLKYYWSEIVKFKPRWMHGPSSTIYNLALIVKKFNLTPHFFEFIELSGEYVQKDHEEFIKEVFQCKIANQYGCREYWPMAYSELDGRLTVVTNNIFIEKQYNEEHKENEIFITLLKNDTWPLVRYRLGDLCDYYFEDDKIYLDIHQGRKAEFFILAGNRRFNAIVFSGIARAICELYGYNAILQFQIIKKSDYELHIKLKLNDKAGDDVLVNYKNEIKKVVGEDINISIEKVSYIKPNDKTGKTQEFLEIK